MSNYQQGKIYKIVSPHTDKIYIGSTTKQYLSQRLAKHKSSFKGWQCNKDHYISSFDLIQLGDVEIILIESYPCNSKDELTARERHWIEQNKELITNKNIPSRTDKERAIERYKNNKEDMDKKSKIYQINHTEELKIKREERYNNNKEYYKQQTANNRENYKKRQKELSSMEYNCICGSVMKKYEKTRHEQSDKHQTYLMIQTL